MLALLAASASGCTTSEAENPRSAVPLPIAVRTTPVIARTLPGSLDVTGTLNADAQTDVAAETSARAMRVHIERGQVVEPGTVLTELDQDDALNQLREAEAVEAQTMARLGIVPGQAFDPLQTPEVRQARVTA
jgi:membrane fusion protein (multidrug efflux system)